MNTKKLFQRAFWATLTLGLALTFGCSEDNTDPNTGGGASTNEEFIISTSDLTYNTVSITVTPPAHKPLYYARLFSDTKAQLGVTDEELLQALLYEPDFENYLYSGEQTFPYAGLIGHSHYRLIYFSYNQAIEEATSPLYRSERITTPDAPEEFDIKIEEVTGLSATITVTPPDQTMTYFYWVLPYENYVTLYEENDNRLHQYDLSFWLFSAEMYGAPLEEVIQQDLITGTRRESTDLLYYLLRWDTRYLVYAYGLDKEANITVPMTRRDFTTKKPAPSDNTFEVSIDRLEWHSELTSTGSIYGYEAEVTITPKNPDEQYFVSIINMDWYEWFFSEGNTREPSDEQHIIYRILTNWEEPSSYLVDQMLRQGVVTYKTWEEHNRLLSDDKAYGVFVFGMSADGPTTGLTIIPFKTDPRPTEN